MNKNRKNNKEVWIESCFHGNRTRSLTIGSEWGCMKGFTKSDCKKLFDAVSDAVKTVFPNAIINPWSDAPYGTPDFE